jgi:hypothetical protein
MLRLGVLIWLLAGTVLAGVAVTVVLLMPGLGNGMMRAIPVAGIGGYVVGIPVAVGIARKILAATAGRPA